MRFLEKFFIALSAIAFGAWTFRLPTTPVLLLPGTQGLALYYLLVFPFLKRKTETGRKWARLLGQGLSGLVLALALHGLLLFAFGWISQKDLLGNACILLALLALVQGFFFWKNREAFAWECLIRALVLLLCLVVFPIWLKPFPVL